MRKTVLFLIAMTFGCASLLSYATSNNDDISFEIAAEFYTAEMYYKAKRIWQQNADKGHPRSQYRLGMMYFDGVGVEKDLSGAYLWLSKAADSGLADAQYVMSQFVVNGFGVAPSDPQLAYRYSLHAATQGHTKAQAALANMLLKGKGVEKENKAALIWLGQAAHKNDLQPQTLIEQLQRLAQQGSAEAQLHLGLIYQLGKLAPKDKAKALSYLKMAADQGNKEAKEQLHELLLQ